jgi:hypothetical protein
VFRCQVRDPEDCSKVRQFVEACSEDIGASLFPILPTAKLAFRQCCQQDRAGLLNEPAGRSGPRVVLFDTGLKAAGGARTGNVCALISVDESPGDGSTRGDHTKVMEATVAFRRHCDLPPAILKAGFVTSPVFPDRSSVKFDPSRTVVVEPNFGWKMLLPQNASGTGASGCENDLTCPDGVRGVADIPPDEHWQEFFEDSPMPTDHDPECRRMSPQAQALLVSAREAARAEPLAARMGEFSDTSGMDSKLDAPLLPSTRLPLGLAKNTRLMRLPKAVWDGRLASHVANTIVSCAHESITFAKRNPASVVTLYNVSNNSFIFACPFLCPLGATRTSKMCASLIFGPSSDAAEAPFKALAVLPLHQAYPSARVLGPVDNPAHSWLHSSPRTPWCNAADFDGKFVPRDDPPSSSDVGSSSVDKPSEVWGRRRELRLDPSIRLGMLLPSPAPLPVSGSRTKPAARPLPEGPPVLEDDDLDDAMSIESNPPNYAPELWDGRIPRGLFLPFVPFPLANEEAINRIFGKWAPILSVSVWSATSGRRINAAVRFASQTCNPAVPENTRRAAWDVRKFGESRYQFTDSDGTDRFLWIRPLENREPRGGTSRRPQQMFSDGPVSRPMPDRGTGRHRGGPQRGRDLPPARGGHGRQTGGRKPTGTHVARPPTAWEHTQPAVTVPSVVGEPLVHIAKAPTIAAPPPRSHPAETPPLPDSDIAHWHSLAAAANVLGDVDEAPRSDPPAWRPEGARTAPPGMVPGLSSDPFRWPMTFPPGIMDDATYSSRGSAPSQTHSELATSQSPLTLSSTFAPHQFSSMWDPSPISSHDGPPEGWLGLPPRTANE